MAINQNQFAMTPTAGMVSGAQGIVRTVQVSLNQATPLVPGQAVKIEDVGNGLPQVLALTTDGDVPMGVVTYNQKNASFEAGMPLELGMTGTLVYMTAGAALAWLQPVHFNYTTKKVVPLVGAYPQVGIAYGKATADGDLIPVWVTVPTQFVDEGHLTA